MIKGTTPTFIFTLPFDTSMVVKARVSFGQDNVEIVCKKETDCKMVGNELSYKMTQEESLKFKHQRPLQIQLKIKTPGGNVVISDTMTDGIELALCKEVL